jgi:hypothetical protein
MKDNTMVYYGPYDAEQLALHMPMDAALESATVEAKESAVPADAHQVGKARCLSSIGCCVGQCDG